MSDATPRPPQVGLAAWLMILGSVGVVVGSYERVADLRSLESREQVAAWAASEPWSGLDVTTTQLLDVLHWATIVLALCAVVTAILGWQVRQGSRPARLVVTVLAAPIFLLGLVSGSILTSIVGAAAVMFWLPPGRWWFDPDKAPPEWDASTATLRRPERPAPAPRAGSPVPPSPQAPGSGWPPAGGADGTPPPHPTAFGAPQAGPVPAQHPGVVTGRPGRPSPGRRPQSVVSACLLTWGVASMIGVVLLLSGATLLLTGSAEVDAAIDDALAQMQAIDPAAAEAFDRGTLLALMLVMIGGLVLWCVAAVVLAVLTWTGREWARWMLLVSAALAGLFMLLGALASPVLLLPAGGCLVTVVLLARGDVSAWMRGQ
ncbi:hypothetical protein [Nocardioides bruguierae]|uniref:hypothetical protein n=1 Tax=Nocardioides bruguierae TaxID=2945102 RepID=UPI0020203807|nr:hypothetical protein [Nocardioides bruguierae]MCL8023957.1 hypothetical protein [Nocardioides bruguierae]